MKNIIFSCLLFLVVPTVSAQMIDDGDEPLTAAVYSQGLRFCEGTVVYRNQILVSNFGTEQLTPLNKDGRGYITSVNIDGKVKIFIPADGNLSAPKGMTIVGGHLFIADVGKVVVYQLSDLKKRPQVITFPIEDAYVNDLEHIADMVLVSVTNSGRIYAINAADPTAVNGQQPQLLGTVPGANGMVVNGSTMYIASFNPEGEPTQDNVIYAYEIFAQQKAMRKLIPDLIPGQYDGVAVSEDGKSLYFTSWDKGPAGKPAVYKYALDGKNSVQVLNLGVDFKGPADISIKGGYIWIPDLPASKLYRFPL